MDSARDGVIRGNTVWNVDSYGNPAYGTDRSADGIYVDGGRDVLVEGNVVHDVNIGIEFASEHAGRATASSRRGTTWCTTPPRSGSRSAATTGAEAAPRTA